MFYFFCRFDDQESLWTRTIIGSIARQFMERLSDESLSCIEHSERTLSEDQMMPLLVDALKQLPSVFVVLDGIDECEDAKTVLRWLNELQRKAKEHSSSVRVFLSCRPTLVTSLSRIVPSLGIIRMPKESLEVQEYILEELEGRLRSGRLRIGDSAIVKDIRKALIDGAQGMFLWIFLQMETICAQRTDEEILKCLSSLPKDLDETFNRCLRKVVSLGPDNVQYCRKVFELVVGALRPLDLEEMRDALSVKPGDLAWSARNRVNDIEEVLRRCGPLIAIDEDELTVHFIHHSVKQHITSKKLQKGLRSFSIRADLANDRLAELCVTFLNLPALRMQVARVQKCGMDLNTGLAELPTTIVSNALKNSQSGSTGRVISAYFKARERVGMGLSPTPSTVPTIDLFGQQEPAPADIVLKFAFLDYCQAYWLHHTKTLTSCTTRTEDLLFKLIDAEVELAPLPWSPDKSSAYEVRRSRSAWIVENEHMFLIARYIVEDFDHIVESGLYEKHKRFLLWRLLGLPKNFAHGGWQGSDSSALLSGTDFMEFQLAVNWKGQRQIGFPEPSRPNLQRFILNHQSRWFSVVSKARAGKTGLIIKASPMPPSGILEYAAASGNVRFVRAILESAADFTKVADVFQKEILLNAFREAACSYAFATGAFKNGKLSTTWFADEQAKIMEVLYEMIYFKPPRYSIDEKDGTGWSPYAYAAAAKHIKLIERMMADCQGQPLCNNPDNLTAEELLEMPLVRTEIPFSQALRDKGA